MRDSRRRHRRVPSRYPHTQKPKAKPKYAVGTPSTRSSTSDEPDMNAKRPPYEALPSNV